MSGTERKQGREKCEKMDSNPHMTLARLSEAEYIKIPR